MNLADLCAGKKVVLIGVPGAFTPNCHLTHLPGTIQDLIYLTEVQAASRLNQVTYNTKSNVLYSCAIQVTLLGLTN